MSSDDAVRQASTQFYAALNRMANGDVGPMADVWSHGTKVTTMHPIGGRDVGWEAIQASFAGVAEIASDGKIALKDQHIHVVGDIALEAGVEHGTFKLAGHDVAIEHRVTNVYQHEGGKWQMIHHHTDMSPAMVEVLSRL